MPKVWIVTMVVVAGLAGLYLILLLFGIRNRLDVQRPASKAVPLHVSKETVFIPTHNFLSIIIFSMKNPDLENIGEFRASLIDKKREDIVRTLEFSGRNLEDPGDVRFQFDPIPDSAGKEMVLRIEDKQENGPAVGIYVGVDEGIAFHSYYRVLGKKAALSTFVERWRDNVSSNLGFFIVWLVILSTIFVVQRRYR